MKSCTYRTADEALQNGERFADSNHALPGRTVCPALHDMMCWALLRAEAVSTVPCVASLPGCPAGTAA